MFIKFLLTVTLLGRPPVTFAETTSALVVPRDGTINGSSGISPCQALQNAGLGDRLLLPTDAGYEPQIGTWWADNNRLRPFCLVFPQTSHEVSTALTALVGANDGAGDWHIAVRSGGHMMVVGANNVVNGVTIDLSLMNKTSYDVRTNVAAIQPGARWGQVYADLLGEENDRGVTVAGGRDGGVGVGGFLIGGGNSFFSGRQGFGCDSVVNFEVVLANGSIVNANATANADLWRALKGGGGNFGIVTRFDMEAIPARDMYYDIRFLSATKDHSDAVVDTVVGFADQDESLNAENALVAYYTHNTTISPDILVVTLYVNTVGASNATTAFDKIKPLPTILRKTFSQRLAAVSSASDLLPDGSKVATSTLTFRNDAEMLRRCVQLHESFVESLKLSIGVDAFTTAFYIQPIPSYLAQIGRRRGGNTLGMDNIQGNAIIWTLGVTVTSDDAAFAVAHAEMSMILARAKELSRSMRVDSDFIYSNYADASQDPLGSYGPANVQHMRHVAAAYDPEGVFQRRVPGGFKISRVL